MIEVQKYEQKNFQYFIDSFIKDIMERRKICRYFEKGSCKKEKCPFVHIRENRKNCQFYLQGYCKKGDNCNFYHPPKEKEQPKQKQKPYKKKEKKFQQQEEQQFEEYVENEDLQQILQQEKKQENLDEDDEKIRKVNLLLGMQYSSSDEEPVQIQIKPKKTLQFTKIYPKKFPDLSKTAESKENIKANEQKYFSKLKFLQLMQKTEDKYEKEHFQVIRKFQDSFRLLKEENEKQYLIRIRPLLFSPEINLHFDMVEDFIELQINSTNYPNERVNIAIMNFSIPQPYKEKILEKLTEFHKKKSLFDTLKYLVNRFQQIYESCKSKLENEHFSQFELQKKLNSQVCTEKNEKKFSKKKRKVKQNNENPDAIVVPFLSNEKISVGNMNYDITIQPIFLQNCEYVLVEKILLFLICKCQQQIIHVLEADRKEMRIGVQLTCRKCQNLIRIALNREVIQVKSTVIGKLGIQNGGLLDIGGISWKFGCECDNQIIKNKIYLPGQKANINCHECFRNMNVSYNGLKHFNPFVKDFQPQNGKELVGRGTCKHMKLSFRWLRYGCCGRVFSCDECHENGSAHPHEKVPGITMLCGFCAIEQPVAPQCIFCRKELVRGVDKGGHWEGGMGCRDQTLLSKKDAKKYTGATKKKNEK